MEPSIEVNVSMVENKEEVRGLLQPSATEDDDLYDDDLDDIMQNGASIVHHYSQFEKKKRWAILLLMLLGIILVANSVAGESKTSSDTLYDKRTVDDRIPAPTTSVGILESVDDSALGQEEEMATASPSMAPTATSTFLPTIATHSSMDASGVSSSVCLELPLSSEEGGKHQRWRCLMEGRFGNGGTWVPWKEANAIAQQAGRPGQNDWQGDNGWAWGHPACPACALDSSLGREEFCSALDKLNIRSIVAVGDSIQASFCNAIGRIIRQTLWRSTSNIDTTIACSGEGYEPFEVTFLYRRNDHLTTDESSKCLPTGGGGINKCGPWTNDFNTTVAALEEGERMLLLINAGPHFHGVDHFENTLVRVGDWVQREFLDKGLGIAVWRNTPPGHHNCSAYNEPVTVAEYESTFGNDTWNLAYEKEQQYAWRFFRRYNEISEAILRRDYPCLRTLDVASSTRLRPDHHKSPTDCLHYGEKGPRGPTFEWARLLHAHLMTIADWATRDKCLL